MSCFFPSILKKNTYKKLKIFLTLAALGAVAFLLSGCAVFKKVGKFITGTTEEASKTAGEIIDKVPEGVPVDVSHKINFEPLAVGLIILLAIAFFVRFLIKKYAQRNIKK